MSASLVYELAPSGSIVAWCDGTPRPPERHKKKLAAGKAATARAADPLTCHVVLVHLGLELVAPA
ncbi:hypothetical protein FHS26_005462 [Rhizobium pisi]|uniref:Uncharacterized protein n=1 Tax=Rhizobium pisi TaxID=574561 RepID=A0A7W5BRB3_9HYPH|nr:MULTISPECIES: hypothetical protein [Rhizobium]MBB3137697.1 hypothetical protein [Rhizobium pisi]MBY5345140.1 hypothetical protein [Rhizobium leguminosarum]MBY5391857.1 hypothetical protein [Rhizobium leguminosarum]MBY5434214.1 hypothetical protein [Rhizobium leguminosarum]NEK38371.1 hypothetical protein [Rhizobium leguminosarum]